MSYSRRGRLLDEPNRRFNSFKSGIFLGIVFFYSSIICSFGQSTPLEIGDLQGHLLIHKTEVYTDSSNSLTVKELHQTQAPFRQINDYGVAISSGNYNTWVHFKLSNKSNLIKNVVFEIPISRMDSFEVFSVNAQQKIKYWGKCYGTGFSVFQKPLKSLSHAIVYNLGSNSVEDIYINIRRFPYTIVNDIKVYEKTAFFKFENTKYSKLGFIYGLYLLEIIICLAFYIVLSRKYLLPFILMITVKVWFISYIFGIFSFYELDFVATNGIIFLIVVIQYWYFKLFFDVSYPRWLIITLFFFCILHSALYPLFKDKAFDYSIIMSIATLILTGILVYEIVGVVRKDYKSATLFLFSQLPAVFSILLNGFSSIIGYISKFYRENDYDILYYSTVIELLIFLVVLIERLWQINKERLYHLKEISILQTEVIEIQEFERQKIAMDLHDDLGTTLALLKDTIERENYNAKEIIKKAISDLRSISHQLMPQEFEIGGFRSSLERFIRSQNIPIELVFFEENVNVPTNIELNMYRILTELIHNAKKHGTSSEINIQITYRPDAVHIAYEEIGNTIPENAISGMGLKSIQTRLQYLKANILENGNRLDGYVFVVEVPIKKS